MAMAGRASLFFAGVKRFFYRLKILFLYNFRLRPRIVRMKKFVSRIVSIKQDVFPRGKSLFIFNGKDDNLYFIVLKEESAISVTEVYDDILNKVPERYNILPQIRFTEVVTSA